MMSNLQILKSCGSSKKSFWQLGQLIITQIPVKVKLQYELITHTNEDCTGKVNRMSVGETARYRRF